MADLAEKLISLLVQSPERGALLIVVLAGAWRILREIFKDLRPGRRNDESLIESLLRENHDLRMENDKLRKRDNG